jgi:Phage integrase family
VRTTPIGTPIAPRNDFREIKKLLTRAGLPPVRLHDLRHTAASLLLAQNVPARAVMEIPGHSQIALTMNSYSHVAPEVSRARYRNYTAWKQQSDPTKFVLLFDFADETAHQAHGASAAVRKFEEVDQPELAAPSPSPTTARSPPTTAGSAHGDSRPVRPGRRTAVGTAPRRRGARSGRRRGPAGSGRNGRGAWSTGSSLAPAFPVVWCHPDWRAGRLRGVAILRFR